MRNFDTLYIQLYIYKGDEVGKFGQVGQWDLRRRRGKRAAGKGDNQPREWKVGGDIADWSGVNVVEILFSLFFLPQRIRRFFRRVDFDINI